MKEEWPKVAIIILNWNGWEDTIECLESLQQSTYLNYQIILVDNGSGDDSLERITLWAQAHFDIADAETSIRDLGIVIAYPQFTFMAAEENLGFGGGNNLGIDYALFGPHPVDFVFLLNNDAQPEALCITKCVGVAQKTNAGVVGAVVMSEKGDEILFAGSQFPKELFVVNRIKLPSTPSEYWPVDRVEGCGMLIHRDLLIKRKREHNYFLDPDLFMYCEETEFCVHTRKWGYQVFLARDARVRHKVALSSGGGGSALSYYYLTRNRIHLARRLLPWWLKLMFHIWYTPSRLFRITQKRIKGEMAVANAISEGLKDGYAGVTQKWGKHVAKRMDRGNR